MITEKVIHAEPLIVRIHRYLEPFFIVEIVRPRKANFKYEIVQNNLTKLSAGTSLLVPIRMLEVNFVYYLYRLDGYNKCECYVPS